MCSSIIVSEQEITSRLKATVASQVADSAGFNVPESYSLLKMPPVGCLISALKKAEDRQEVILRLFNPAESATCDATVAFSREVISCSETMMDEHITTEENQGSNLSGPFLPGQSRTFSYRLA